MTLDEANAWIEKNNAELSRSNSTMGAQDMKTAIQNGGFQVVTLKVRDNVVQALHAPPLPGDEVLLPFLVGWFIDVHVKGMEPETPALNP